MMRRTTVNERMKATGGLVVGPNHPAFRDIGMKNKEKMDEGKPPNLRDAAPGEPTCEQCAQYEEGTCKKYGYPVNDNEVSDDFEPAGEESSEGSGKTEMMEDVD